MKNLNFIFPLYLSLAFISIILLNTSCVFCNLSNMMISSELDNMKIFYDELIIKNNMTDRVEIIKNEKELNLKAMQNFDESTPILGVDSKYIFSSCDFFPFVEVIIKALKEYVQQHSASKDSLDINQLNLIASYTLVYNILYFKFGDIARAKHHYEKFIPIDQLPKNSYVKFNRDSDVKRYLLNLPFYSIKSSLSFNEQENDIAKSLDINLMNQEKVSEVFNFVKDYVKEKLELEIQLAMKSFISSEVDFNTVLTFLQIKKFFLPEEGYAKLFIEDLEEYNHIKGLIYPDEYKPKMCKMIGPILDLFKFKIEDSSQNINEIQFFKISDSLLGIGSTNFINENEIISFTELDRLPNEIHYLSTGKLPEQNFYDFVNIDYKISKSEITQEQMRVCRQLQCGGAELNYFWQKMDVKEVTINLPLFKLPSASKNNQLMKMFKIFSIEKVHESLMPYLDLNVAFNHNVEAKALTNYYNTILPYTKKFSLEKLIEDYEKILYLKNKSSKNIGNILESIDIDYDTILNLYKLAIEKQHILNLNLKNILENMQKNALDDIKKIKKLSMADFVSK